MTPACFTDDGLMIGDFESLPIPVQIDLICCFASYASTFANETEKPLSNQVQRERAVVMLTVVSIILHEPGPFLVDCLRSLSMLLATPFVCHLASKRHRLVNALQTYLCDEEVPDKVRALAMTCVRLLLGGIETQDSLVNGPIVQLIRALCKTSKKERDPRIQLAMVHSLGGLCEVEHLLHFPQEAAMALLNQSDNMSHELSDLAATMFFRTITTKKRRQGPIPSLDELLFAVCLLTSIWSAVRLRSVKLLEDISFRQPERISYILEETDCLDHLCGLLYVGKFAETRLILAFCKQASFNLANLQTMCLHVEFVDALVVVVSRGDGDTARSSLDVLCLLALHFGSLPEIQKVLPWFVRLALTTSSNTIKTQLVGAIRTLSQSCMESV